MKSDKSSKAVNVDGQPSVFARHNTEMNIPRLPLQRGEERSEGGMLSLQRGNAEAKRVGETGDPLGGGLLIQLLIVMPGTRRIMYLENNH